MKKHCGGVVCLYVFLEGPGLGRGGDCLRICLYFLGSSSSETKALTTDRSRTDLLHPGNRHCCSLLEFVSRRKGRSDGTLQNENKGERGNAEGEIAERDQAGKTESARGHGTRLVPLLPKVHLQNAYNSAKFTCPSITPERNGQQKCTPAGLKESTYGPGVLLLNSRDVLFSEIILDSEPG